MYGSQNEGWGVVIKFDSQLATSQVKGEYQIKYTLKKKRRRKSQTCFPRKQEKKDESHNDGKQESLTRRVSHH